MPSTYTLNNGIELIATGEQSGTWGDTTNTNLSLVDTALDGQVTVTLPSAGTSGSPNTLAISDGAASDGRNRMVIFNDGGDLGATAYVQLTPNDAEKIIYVRNDLAGSRSIILFQGTYNASNDYELPAGTTAVIYFDGAGSGAVAANVFNNAYFDSLRLGSVSVTAILDEDDMSSDSATALATQQSIKAYVDTQITAEDLDFAGDSGTGAVDLDSQTFTVAGTTNEIETSASGQTLTIGLPDDVTIAGDLTVDTDTLYVDSTDNRVGIGTSLPSRSLHISGGTNSMVIERTDATTSALLLVAESNNNAIYSRASNLSTTARDLVFNMGSTEAMRIDSSQRVLIGYDTSKAIGSSSTGILQIHDTTAFSILARYTSGTGGPLFVLGKAKTDTIGGNTLVANADTLGNIRFAGADGTDVQSYAAEIVTQVDGTPGSNDMPGRLTFWTTLDGTSSSTERMRISQDGNVAIGDTTTDFSRLAVKGSFADAESTGFDSQVMFLTNDSASKLTGITMIAASDNGTIAQVGRIGTYNVHPATGYLGEMTFSTRDGTNMVEAMRIDSVQRVNIGGTQTAINASSSKLQVLGDSKSTSLISSLRFSNDSGPPHFIFGKSRSGTISTVGTTVQSGDTLGYLAWAADDGTDLGTAAAAIDVQVDGTPGSNDMPGRMRFLTTPDGSQTPTERMRINNAGDVKIGSGDPTERLHVDGEVRIEGQLGANLYVRDEPRSISPNYGSSTGIKMNVSDRNGNGSWAGVVARGSDGFQQGNTLYFITQSTTGSEPDFSSGNIPSDVRMIINRYGYVGIGTTTDPNNTTSSSPRGQWFNGADGHLTSTVYQAACAVFNRLNNDGQLVQFKQAGVTEGTVSVSGTTVSYNGGHLARWSQTTDNTRIDGVLKGTVMTNLDQMAVWGDEENEQLNCMAVSSVEGDPNVAGVFVNWDDDDAVYTADMNIAMTGDMIIRIAQGTTVARGDLLMSAGNGTAKPQGDDIVRSKTIAKVTSTHVTCTYDDGSYCVPCVLMAC